MGRNSRVFACLFACLLTVFGSTVCRAQSSPQSRITQAVDASQMTALQGNVHGLARPQFDRGPVSSAMKMNVMIAFRPSASQQAAMDELMAEQQDPTSPNYHKWLTHAQFGARFGMSASDLAKVSAWLRSQGLTVGAVSPSRNSLFFSGTAAQVQSALHTEIHNYQVNGETRFANATEPEVPAAMADVVQGFLQLNNFQPHPHVQARTISAAEANPHFTSSQSGSHFLSPGDFATIYDVAPLYNAGFDGTGEGIAVLGQTTISTGDVDSFRTAAGLPARTTSNFQQVLASGTGTAISCSTDLAEAQLDVEWSVGVAKGATLYYVYAGRGTGTTCNNRTTNVWNAMQYAIQTMTPKAPVISTSYGLCEPGNGPAFANMVRGWIQQANTQGQTVTAASGDTGAADCDDAPAATQGLQVDMPASIPEVTAVGGTEFTGDATSTSTTQYWQGASGSDTISSALSYIPETSWNDTPSDNTGANPSFAASGGGASTFFTKPAWQTVTGVPAANHRYVPDVALSASLDHDSYLFCLQGSCVNGFRAGDNSLSVVGGTSVGAQVMGGIVAILNQATHSTGLGNINPELYTLYTTTPLAFHDITSGNNDVPCTQGSTNCPASAPFQIGYSATANYDEVTGLGSLDANLLAQAWPGFSVAQAATTVTISASPSNSIPAGSIVTFTATVAATGGSGPTPTGTVQFTLDGVNDGSPATIGANGAASHTDNSLTVGTHTVVAIYSGDSNYLGSTSTSFTETVTNNFTLSAAPTSLTASPGGAPTSVITVSSPASNGFSGTVNLTCSVSPATQVTCSLSPNSVVLNSTTTSATSTLTVTTVASSAITTTSADARQGRAGWLAASTGALFAGVVLAGAPSRKRRWLALLGLAVLIPAALGVGCGGGSSSSTSTGTPAGSYTITVTGSSGTNSTTQQTTQVSLTVN